MSDDNVVQLPSLLDRLASRMIGLMDQEASNHKEWTDIQYAMCTTLLEARNEFKADIEFGQWCERNGFGEKLINPNTRAAMIEMARDSDGLIKCLEVTERKSLHTIYKYEFGRFRNVSKPPGRNAGRPRNTSAPQRDKATEVYRELKDAGQKVTASTVSEKAGVSKATAERAIIAGDAEAGLSPMTPAEMRAVEQKRFDLAVRKARAELKEELKSEVYAELDIFVRHVKEEHEKAVRILAGYKGIMSRDAFRKIKACLHPDHNTFSQAAEAFRIFSELEDVLVKPDEVVFTGPPLPETVAELMARRRTH